MAQQTRRTASYHGVDASTLRRILLHEAQVHAVPGREVSDLGDAILLHDPAAPDLFWNRAEALRWPTEHRAFDRRLDQLLVQFAALDRRPHVWGSPAFDSPTDLADRLHAAGFRETGPGMVMVLVDADAAMAAERRGLPPDVTLERLSGETGQRAAEAAGAIGDVLISAFEVDERRLPGVIEETGASLADDRFMHYLLRWRDEPAAVARRATFDGLSYLSSIGTAPPARGHGLAAMVTAAVVRDCIAIGSDWISLGVFAENDAAIRLYRRLGFEVVGSPGPDLVLIG